MTATEMDDAKENSDTKESSDELEEGVHFPQTYIVIKMGKNVKHKTLSWLVDKIKGQRRDGGAELIVRQQPYDPDEGVVLHISASKIKFLEVAEEMELRKQDLNGIVREFIVNQLEDFIAEGMTVDDLLTVAERQTIVRHELENIRALAEDAHVPGYVTYPLYEGQSIVQVCQHKNIITKIYPLHDKEALKKLGKIWYLAFFNKQPFEEIRLYFGEAISLYFTFLGFYTTALLFPLVLGFIQYFVSTETVPFFCVFNVVWVTVFLEIWKRKSNELAFSWGTIGMTSLDEPRPNFHGQMGVDPVTGRRQPKYPRWKTNAKMYCVSFPIVLVCMLFAFCVMLASFWVEDMIRKMEDEFYLQFVLFPSIVYAALVYIMNRYYRRLATFLTEWENHRTQSQFDRHRVSKLVLFEFVNNFMCLFYIAFVIQDMEMLKMQLGTMFIIYQLINNFQEAVLPLLVRVYHEKMSKVKGRLFGKSHKNHHNSKKNTNGEKEISSPLKDVPEIPEYDQRIVDATKEGEMDRYEGTFDDYLEMFVQFGYVVLFSSVYPISALWAVLNNVLEIRADAFKLCKVYQRPMSRRVKDIGAWQLAFEIVGAMSIMTNCGLLALSPRMRQRGEHIPAETWYLLFVILEHLLLGIRYVLHKGIPDRPEWVRVELARSNWESKQALKHERAHKNRKILTRKFKTVHGSHNNKKIRKIVSSESFHT